MILQPKSVGLDVHALSVVPCAIDGQTCEVFKQRLCRTPVRSSPDCVRCRVR